MRRGAPMMRAACSTSCMASWWALPSGIGPLNGDTGQGDIVGFARAEERNFLEVHQDLWNHQVGSAAAFQPFGNGGALGFGDGGEEDQLLALFLVWNGNDGKIFAGEGFLQF